jgi:gluconolactonase
MRSLAAAATLGALLLCTACHKKDVTATPAIDGVVAGGTKIELVKDGFRGTEGPLALTDGSLIFTEAEVNRITRIAPDGAVSAFLENSNGSTGLAFNASGDLIAVQAAPAGIGILYPADRARILVSEFAGQPFNRPNDLVVDKKGGVYFTDPGARPAAGQPPPKPAVYYLPPDGSLLRLDVDTERPNGIQLSLDERTLYVSDTSGDYVLAYDIAADGSVSAQKKFAKLKSVRKTANGTISGADGLAVDAEGRLYVATAAGIQIFTAAGKSLGIIELPKAPQNVAFAGPDKKTLYSVGRGAVYRIAMLTSGFAGRAK